MSPTVRWRVIWLLVMATLGVVDLRREQLDIDAGRSHTTGTTFSCFCRWMVTRIPGGRHLFRGGLGWLHWWFDPHILKYV